MSSLGQADNPEVDMVMDLDRLSPELVMELVGIHMWDWEEIESGGEVREKKFVRVELRRIKKKKETEYGKVRNKMGMSVTYNLIRKLIRKDETGLPLAGVILPTVKWTI